MTGLGSAKTCRAALPAGYSYIANLKRKQHGVIGTWDPERRAGIKRIKAGSKGS